MEKNTLGVIALALAVGAIGLVVGLHLNSVPVGSSKDGGTSVVVNGGSYPSPSEPAAPVAPTKFGADTASLGDVTVTSILGASTLSLGSSGGIAATTTFTGTTSTVSFPGRTCFWVTSPTGTRFSVQWIGGQPVSAFGQTCGGGS